MYKFNKKFYSRGLNLWSLNRVLRKSLKAAKMSVLTWRWRSKRDWTIVCKMIIEARYIAFRNAVISFDLWETFSFLNDSDMCTPRALPTCCSILQLCTLCKFLAPRASRWSCRRPSNWCGAPFRSLWEPCPSSPWSKKKGARWEKLKRTEKDQKTLGISELKLSLLN